MKKITLIGLLIIGLVFQNCKNNKTQPEVLKNDNIKKVVVQEIDSINTINFEEKISDTIVDEVIEIEEEKTVKKQIISTKNEAVATVKKKEEEVEKIIDKTIKDTEVALEKEIIDKTTEVVEPVIEKIVKEETVTEPIIEKTKTVIASNNWVVPSKYQEMTNPEDASKENIAIGKSMYSKHCKSCHGKNGYGDGPKADEVDGALGDFSSEEFQEQSDGALFYKSYIGRKDMPNFEKKMTEEDMWLTVHYMRTLAE